MAINVGTKITAGAEEYLIKRSLSSGGFGETFLAERTKPTAKEVVVKVPRDDVLNDPIWSQKFAREARILANISHPNVVKVIAFWDFQTTTGDMALVQELVVGASELTPYLTANPDHAASIFLQSLYALRAFHGTSTPAVVHRDLSPRNILVSSDGVAKVIDFGLAKEDPRATTVLTVKGERFGTPGCMSPEQLSDAASVDHRTDLFAIGRTFAAALQRRNPQVAQPERLPEPWKTICTGLTEHDAGDRYQSANEALTAAMLLFAKNGIRVEHIDRHLLEMAQDPVDGWSLVCQNHFFALPDLDHDAIQLVHRLDASLFGPPFDANGLFDRLEAGSAVQEVATSSFIVFEDADPIGNVYARLYPYLDVPHKRACFERLCGIAVRRHRFSIMIDVRSAYASEPDPQLREQLMQILDTEDPGKVIEGRGVLPR